MLNHSLIVTVIVRNYFLPIEGLIVGDSIESYGTIHKASVDVGSFTQVFHGGNLAVSEKLGIKTS